MSNYSNPVSATLNGIADLFRKKEQIGELTDTERLDGKTALVTGANSGLGKATAIALARRGARVILACRSGHDEAVADIKQASGNDAVESVFVDLADLNSVRHCVAALAERELVLDRVILNAGVVPNHDQATEQGFELMFGVHFVGNMALVQGLLERDVIRPAADSRPRIIFVASETHRSGTPINPETFGDYVEYNAMGSIAQYGHSKRALVAYAQELARRLGDEAGVHALCPGPINSNIARGAPGWVKPILGFAMGKLFASPEQASEPVVYLACAEAMEGRTGLYLHLMTEKPPHEQTLDPVIGKAVWETGECFIQK